MFGAEFRKLLKVFIERGDQSSFDIETKIKTIVFLVTVGEQLKKLQRQCHSVCP